MKRKVHKAVLIAYILLLLIFIFYFSFYSSQSFTDLNVRQQSDNWSLNHGYVDQIIFKEIDSEKLMMDALRTGEIDMIGQNIDQTLITHADLNDPGLELTTSLQSGYGGIAFRNDKFPTNIRAIRQAVAYAFDKHLFQRQVLNNLSIVVDSPLVPSVGIWSCEHPSSNCYFPNHDTYYEADPLKGNQTLLNVGFYDVDGDGWRELFNGITAEWNGTAVEKNDYDLNDSKGHSYNGYTQNNRTFAMIAGLNTTLNPSDVGIDVLKPEYRNENNWIQESELKIIIGEAKWSRNPQESISIIFAIAAFHSLGIKAKVEYITFYGIDYSEPSWVIRRIHGLFSTTSSLGLNPLYLTYFSTNYLNYSLNPQYSTYFTSEDEILEFNFEQLYNETFDNFLAIIESSANYTEVLKATYNAQRILWQEQPVLVIYNDIWITMYRTNKFTRQFHSDSHNILSFWSLVKTHLKPTTENMNDYPDWPLGGTLLCGLNSDLISLNTLREENIYTHRIMQLNEEPLLRQHPETNEFIGQLAYKWEREAPCFTDDCITKNVSNGSKITFHLLNNVTWHDGTSFTADDVIFTFKMLLDVNSPV
ncbi:MAG: ABC transporter substrate-binding protein, partial [Candidatus Hodarchaeales archaeon]